MTSLLWVALPAAVILGMCAGAAMSREYRRPVRLRAQRAEAALAQLREERAVEQRPLEVPTAAQPAPIVVNVHMTPQYPAWPQQPPVIDAQVVPALEMRDQ